MGWTGNLPEAPAIIPCSAFSKKPHFRDRREIGVGLGAGADCKGQEGLFLG